jgi:hypothetical protein
MNRTLSRNNVEGNLGKVNYHSLYIFNMKYAGVPPYRLIQYRGLPPPEQNLKLKK